MKCQYCGRTFYTSKHMIQRAIAVKGYENGCNFCCRKCKCEYQTLIKTIRLNCEICNKDIIRTKGEMKGSKHFFCGRSCAAKYHNAHKTTGTRVSKLEKWLQEQLLLLYPNLEFHFNKTSAIKAELDIYIPSLRLAFELNGIFHYETVFGKDKLAKTQNSDNRKFAACLEKTIGLCIIDTSTMKYFKESNCLKYLKIITDIIDQTISLSV